MLIYSERIDKGDDVKRKRVNKSSMNKILGSSGPSSLRRKTSLCRLIRSKIPREAEARPTHVEARMSSFSNANIQKFKTSRLNKRNLDSVHIYDGERYFKYRNLGAFYYSHPLVGANASQQLTELFRSILQEITAPTYLIWCHTFRPCSLKTRDKNFEPFPKSLTTALESFGLDVLENYVPEHLMSPNASLDDEFVRKMPLEYEDACKEIIRRRGFYEKSFAMVRHTIHAAMKTLRNYHYDTFDKSLMNCKRGSECANHLTWKKYKQKRVEDSADNT
uniref:Uncharacterized protein n=1 Tax=Caenorhabditis japonica TaxID=281687 RepID=A0A8R1HWS2_CAEJA